jgi:hypothetical protein
VKTITLINGSVAFILVQNTYGQDTILTHPGTFESILGYTCDLFRNFTGEIGKGNVFMGLLDAHVLILTDRL